MSISSLGEGFYGVKHDYKSLCKDYFLCSIDLISEKVILREHIYK